tara:strand:- start:1 stop:444 length:444 start_codon:yes stop_codon:yes gene_type:complete
MRAKTFLRRNTREYSKLGLRRKKLQKWRAPKGRDNKMRLREKGRPSSVEIGYKQDTKTRGKIDDREIRFVQNISDMKDLQKGSVVELGRMGAKKKLDLMKVVKEKDLKVVNFSFGLFEKSHKVKKEKKTKKKEARKKKIAERKEAKK